MKRLTVRPCAPVVAAALCLATVLRLAAQSTVPAAPAADQEDADTIKLSPFVVSGEEDADSYTATSTLGGTRVRTELKDLSTSLSVITKQFLQDTGSKNTQDLLTYTTNTEVGGLRGNFSSTGAGSTYGDQGGQLLRPNNQTRVRGLDSADNTRDYFQTDIPWDGFNVERVDLQRGPNSILFGIGSPAGIINTSVNIAAFKNKNVIETRIDKFGSIRASGDFNYVLLKNQLAVRVAVLDDETIFRQKPAYNHDKRVFAAIKYNPHFFGEGSTTSFRGNFEAGEVNANRPRAIPPIDTITPWFLTGLDTRKGPTGADVSNMQLNKFTYSMVNLHPQAAPFSDAANRAVNPSARLFNSAMGRQFWLDTTAYYGNNAVGSPTGFRQTANGSGRWGLNPAGTVSVNSTTGKPNGGIDGLFNTRPYSVTVGSSYFNNSGFAGGSYYSDLSLADPSVFDFYNNLIDGDNKFEWQKWHSSNWAFSQTFFHDRLGVEAVFDYQNYRDGQRTFLGGGADTYKIGVDIVNTFSNGEANPNVGRAYVASTTEQANRLNEIIREGIRITAFGDIRASDFLKPESRLAKILGRHVFTGLYSQDTKNQFGKSWATSAATPAFTQFTGESDALGAHFRSFNYVVYLSGDLRGLSSASGANVDRVRTLVKAPRSAPVRVFDNTWARSRNPLDSNYVDPAAPYVYSPQNSQLPGGPALVNSTQSENPANYVGWKNLNVDYLDADNGDIDALTYSSGRNKEIVSSQAFTWQGHMFWDALVPTFGWRRDKLETLSGSPTPNALGIVTTDYTLDPKSRRVTYGENKSWGAMLHIPRKWTEALPGKTTFSVFFNRGNNNRVSLRGDVFGNSIDNPRGQTKEYGVVVNTLNDKLSLRLTRYETAVKNATLGGGNPLGSNSYYLWAVPVWGTAMVARDDQFIKGNSDSVGSNWAATDDAGAPQRRLPDGSLNPAWVSHPSTQQQIAAINAWRALPVNQQFFNAYGGEVGVMSFSALQAGNWTAADPLWAQKIDNQPQGGGLVGFGGSGPQFTVDTVSKGYELEILAQPTKNWNIAVNASKTFATRQNLAPSIVAQINAMTTFFDGPAGDYRWWGGGVTNRIRDQWRNNIINPYNTFKSQEGFNAPEIAPWRFNAISTYRFEEGRLKGFFVGGAYRWEQAKVLGYQYNQALDSGRGGLEIGKPWKGAKDAHVDMWFGYSRKLNTKINWRIQANLKSVGEKIGLVPVTINPDGTTGYSRIQEGMVWQLTNTLEF